MVRARAFVSRSPSALVRASALLALAGQVACGAAAQVASAPSAPSALGSVNVEARAGREIRWRGGTFHLTGVEIEGNEHAPTAELLAAMRLTTDRAIDEELLERDELVIAAYYYDRGYVMVHVEPIALTRAEFGDELRAHVVVREGPVITVRAFDVYEQRAGDARAPLSVSWTRPPLEGRPFGRAVFAEALRSLRARYHDRGQAEADTSVVDALDVASRTMTLDVGVAPGGYFHLGTLYVTGNRARSTEAILGELAIRAGDLYSERALELALARLKNLPWFSDVVISTHRGRAADTIDLHLEVVEIAGLDTRAALAPVKQRAPLLAAR